MYHSIFVEVSSKIKLSRSNLSWSNLMRKSMKKLKSFQLPQQQQQQEQIESALSNPIVSPIQTQSSSIDQNPIHNIECEKENEPHVVSLEVDVTSENPDIFHAVLQQQQQETNESRPRQYGRRRSNPIRISSSINVHESVNHATAVNTFLNFILYFLRFHFKASKLQIIFLKFLFIFN